MKENLDRKRNENLAPKKFFGPEEDDMIIPSENVYPKILGNSENAHIEISSDSEEFSRPLKKSKVAAIDTDSQRRAVGKGPLFLDLCSDEEIEVQMKETNHQATHGSCSIDLTESEPISAILLDDDCVLIFLFFSCIS